MFLDWEKRILWKWLYYSMQFTDSMQCLSNYQNGIYHRTRANNLRASMETQRIPNSQSKLEKENRAEWIRLLDFRIYFKAIVIKTVQGCFISMYDKIHYKLKKIKIKKKGNVDDWNRIECWEINPCTYSQLIYNKGGKNTEWRKDSVFNK